MNESATLPFWSGIDRDRSWSREELLRAKRRLFFRSATAEFHSAQKQARKAHRFEDAAMHRRASKGPQACLHPGKGANGKPVLCLSPADHDRRVLRNRLRSLQRRNNVARSSR